MGGINESYITYYYFTLLNYLNHSTTFFKYPYYSSKTLKWVQLILHYTSKVIKTNTNAEPP